MEPKASLWGGIKQKLSDAFSSEMTYDRNEYLKEKQATETPAKPVYKVRGMDTTDDDWAEAEKVLYSEISNRPDHKQEFEARHILNTAVNRMAARKKSLGDVLREPYQYQGYAPKGVKLGGKTVQSQYQKIATGSPDISSKKLAIIRRVLEEAKTGKLKDTTGGAEYYTHASDGTIWIGKTIAEAKQNAMEHERRNGLRKTQFGTAIGLPVYD